MEVVVLLLWMSLQQRRKRTYTREQLEEIARTRAAVDGGAPALNAPRRPYRWWRYAGFW